MAFFSTKKKPDNEKVKSIRPVVVRTENVAKEIMNIAAGNDVATASLDFNILDIKTLTRMGAEAKENEWEELSSDEVAHFLDDNMMLNPIFEIKQTYEIEVFSISKPDTLTSLNLSVGVNPSLTKAYLTIKAGSSAVYFDGFETALINLINKKKLRANLMISLFDEPMSKSVQDIAARIRVNHRIKFEENERLLIAQGIESAPTTDDDFILHYEQKQKMGEDESGRVDYSRRGYLISAVENELLMEYIKPELGKAGRNCRGEYIVPKEPKVTHEPAFGISDKIDKVETDERIEYRAKQSGYVTFENNVYDINTEMDISEISFKATGSIESQLDADVSINVKETDIFKDAIGMGMDVEVKELNVEGNTGSNSKVYAGKAVIGGQTHQSSEIYADEMTINIHKGKAVGKKIRVTRLEHGTIEGDEVTVTQAIGGTIRARKIYVEILGSHVTMTAVERIEIGKLRGEENKLIIDPSVMLDSKNDRLEHETKVKESKHHIIELQIEIDKYQKLTNENRNAFVDLKKRLLNYKKNGVQMPTTFVKKYKQFQQMHTHLQSLEKELEQKEEHLELLAAQQKAFQRNIFNARVVNKGRWHGHNEVIFKLIEPDIEVSLIPDENSSEHLFALYEDKENEEFSVISVNE